MEKLYNPLFSFLGLLFLIGAPLKSDACMRCFNFHNDLCTVAAGSKEVSVLKVKVLEERMATVEEFYNLKATNVSESRAKSAQATTPTPAFQDLHQTFLSITSALERRDTTTVPTYLTEYLSYLSGVTNTIVKVLEVYRGDYSLKFSTINVWRWKDISEQIGQEFFTMVSFINDNSDVYVLRGTCQSPWTRNPFPRKNKGDEVMRMMIDTCRQCRKKKLECAVHWSADTTILKNLLCTAETVIKVKVLKKLLLRGPLTSRSPFKYKNWSGKDSDRIRVTFKTPAHFSKRDLEVVQQSFGYNKDKIWGGIIAAKVQVLEVYKGDSDLQDSLLHVHSDEFLVGANMEDKNNYILAGTMVDETNILVKYSEHNEVFSRLQNTGRIEKQELLIREHLGDCDCQVQLNCDNSDESAAGCDDTACTHRTPGFCEENLACARNASGHCRWKPLEQPSLADEYGNCLKILYGKKWRENAVV